MKTDLYFDVVGAGNIQISKSAEYQCGGKIGFSFGVEWGTHGYTGGVLSQEEAVKLAEHILKTCKLKMLRQKKLEKINEIKNIE